jgi:hypothetical protein
MTDKRRDFDRSAAERDLIWSNEPSGGDVDWSTPGGTDEHFTSVTTCTTTGVASDAAPTTTPRRPPRPPRPPVPPANSEKGIIVLYNVVGQFGFCNCIFDDPGSRGTFYHKSTAGNTTDEELAEAARKRGPCRYTTEEDPKRNRPRVQFLWLGD